jgi:hypothetical protein
MSKTGPCGFEAFHTFCQTLKGAESLADDGVIPSISIFRSPFKSNGIGWDNVDAGSDNGWVSRPPSGWAR